MDLDQQIRYVRLQPVVLGAGEPTQWYAAATLADGAGLAAVGESQEEALTKLAELIVAWLHDAGCHRAWPSGGFGIQSGGGSPSLC